MNKITSVSNQKIKDISKLHQRKYRELSDTFLVEGEKAFEEILNTGLEICEIFVSDEKLIDTSIDINKYHLVNEAVMKKLTSTESAPKIALTAFKPKYILEDFKNFNNIILLENIKDAGNLGTIIRSAAAFKIDGIILCGDTVDLFNPKVLRSAAGNFFKVRVIHIHKDIEKCLQNFQDFKIIATSLKECNSIAPDDLKNYNKKIILFGSEAEGLSEQLLNFAAYNLQIPMQRNVESLNLSVAASIILYEIYKTLKD